MPRDTDARADCKSNPEPATVTLLEKWTLIHAINKDPHLSTSAKVVAVDLMWRMNCKYQTCFPKQETIARDTGLSERTIVNACKELREAEYLEWRRQPNGVNVYKFRFYHAHKGNDGVEQTPDENLPVKRVDPISQRILDKRARAESAPDAGAKSAPLYNTGKDITREEDTEPSTASPSKARVKSSEKPSDPVSAEPLQEGSAEWWKTRVWNETGAAMRARFYPTQSRAAFGKRLGETLKRQKWDYPAVDRAMRACLAAEPALDAWEYVAGVLRKRSADPVHDYSQPNIVRGLM